MIPGAWPLLFSLFVYAAGSRDLQVEPVLPTEQVARSVQCTSPVYEPGVRSEGSSDPSVLAPHRPDPWSGKGPEGTVPNDLVDSVALSLAGRRQPALLARWLAEQGPGPGTEEARVSLPSASFEVRKQGSAPSFLLRGAPGRPWPEWRAEAVRTLDLARQAGLVPVTRADAAYPPRLATIVDPPVVLWVRGDPAALALPMVAVVGSRAATPYALEVAAVLARDLAAEGLAVVSGLARGVDAAAHRAALEAGRTVAVLGCGADVTYPAEHKALAQRIVRTGALVSELPPGTPPRAHHFPLRNRILSGLALAVVVVEASNRSGSLITARLALEQGRDVLAVPGNVLAEHNRGAHALLRDGARLVESVDDVLDEIGWRSQARGGGSMARTASDWLLAVMTPGDACDVDALVARTGRESAAVLERLLALELDGVVSRSAGRFTRRVTG
ncbi:MAG: DNA-protecting protein DprA [Luteitalea sp.]|nr:DNA-protecting protein DprA [Luteitalea sp.]